MAENPLDDILLTALQGAEDLEIAARTTAEIGAGRAGEAATVVLLGTIH